MGGSFVKGMMKKNQKKRDQISSSNGGKKHPLKKKMGDGGVMKKRNGSYKGGHHSNKYDDDNDYNNNKNDKKNFRDSNNNKKFNNKKNNKFNKRKGKRQDDDNEEEDHEGSESEGFDEVRLDESGRIAKGDSDDELNDEDLEYDSNDDEFDGDDDDEDLDEEEKIINKQLQAANRKKKKSGGFQSMGLSNPVFTAILHKGYKVPTPIQRKSIPIVMEGRDIVAMARTGSGKTAAFLIPMVEKLKAHSAKVGARGLILSPSRELAMQTLKFTKDLAKYTDLRTCMIVGGDSLDEQFAAIANNPDIIIATPGRLMHLIIEMNLDLKSVEYVVFDEADRLFEMGFAEQLKEITFRLPESRQTLLFSATLPKLLVDFAKAGLTDPILIRLDVDSKIPSDLQMMFFSIQHSEKDAALLYTLNHLIAKDEMTIVFVATKHHVEYVSNLLEKAGHENTYIYGSLDQQARKIGITKFRTGKVKLMVVTDVAARGIDVPLLDHVINYDFPGQSKVFVHRVGRAARAGRKGIAWNFVSSDELPYMLDLQLFTGRPLGYGNHYQKDGAEPDYTKDIIIGTVPQPYLDVEKEAVIQYVASDITLATQQQSALNGYKLYFRTRPQASKESYKRAKQVSQEFLGVHPIVADKIDEAELVREQFLRQISGFRPAETIFEVGKRGGKDDKAVLMQKRRIEVGKAIIKKRINGPQELSGDVLGAATEETQPLVSLEQADEQDLLSVFNTVDGGSKRKAVNDDDDDEESTSTKKKQKTGSKKQKAQPDNFRDSEFYIPHVQADIATERGYSMQNGANNTFTEVANKAIIDLNGDDAESIFKKRGALTWDSRKKKFIRKTIGADNKERIRTDAGQLVLASYKSDAFADWKKRTKLQLPRLGEQELPSSSIPKLEHNAALGTRRYRHYSTNDSNSADYQPEMVTIKTKGGKRVKKVAARSVGKKGSGELRSRDEIVKGRKMLERRKEKNARPSKKGKGSKGRR